MTARRVGVHFGMASLMAAFALIAWAARPKVVPLPAEFLASRNPIPAEFADDARCASCHPEVAERFAHSGMGKAFVAWRDAAPIEDRTEGKHPVLTLGDLHYQVVIDNGRMFQREFRIAGGAEVELNRREAKYVIGSGTKGRGYLASVDGYLFALPISWYTDRKAWDFSPGYRQANPRFDRPINHECMSCHNSAFGTLPGTVNGYLEPLPTGLGCQRCHGPAAAHIVFHEEGRTGRDPMPKIAALPPRAQLDVCLQCHLLSDDKIPRGDCGPFRPGDRLADCRVDFFLVEKADAFDAVGHGPRTMASKCYIASGGKMTCTTCHDPHKPAAGVPRAVYNRKCNDCHQKVICKRPLAARESPTQGDCVSCHMPRKKADDIPHATSTEHWIHVPGRSLGAPFPRPKDPQAKIAAWGADAAPIENTVAELRHAIRLGDLAESTRRSAELEDLLKRDKSPHRTAWLELARANLRWLMNPERAKAAAERVLAVEPKNAAALETYANALGLRGNVDGKAEILERMLRAEPWRNLNDLDLVNALATAKAERRAFDVYERYLQFHPPSVDVLIRLGEMKGRQGRRRDAEAFFEKAQAADGARPEPLLARAGLALLERDFKTARKHAERAALVDPGNPEVGRMRRQTGAERDKGDRQ